MGANVNPNTEHEFTPESNIYGFKVTITYSSEGNFKILPNNTEVFNNVSEVHTKYKGIGCDRIAIVSATHKDSYSYDFDDIESIIIEMADSFENNI